MKHAVIIVAGGKGTRMGSGTPKQFLLLKGKPVLMHTIEKFHSFDEDMRIIVLLPVEQMDYWKQLCMDYAFTIPHCNAQGGATRFHSVRNGLALLEAEGLIGVHNGVRPLVSLDVIENCYHVAESKHAVIPVTDVVETIRLVEDDNISKTVSRDRYKLVQTPQVFAADLLKKAYEQPFSPNFTDDASVVESFGQPVYMVEGNRENIKLTTPFDLKVAESLL